MSGGGARLYTFAQLEFESARISLGFELIERAIQNTQHLQCVFPEMSVELVVHRAQLKYALRLLRDIAPVDGDELGKLLS